MKFCSFNATLKKTLCNFLMRPQLALIVCFFVWLNMGVGDKAAMSNCKPLSFQVVRPKFSRVCYDLITHSQSGSGLKSAKAYDISSQESPLMKCIRRNLLFPKRYFNRNSSKRSKKLLHSSFGTKLLKQSNEHSKVNTKWENFHRMKETFQPKVANT